MEKGGEDMKISRKMHRQVEAKIRHAMATGHLPLIERSTESGTGQRGEPGKAEGNESGQGK